MKSLKKFNELFINRDEPKTPFHGSEEPKKWGEQGRHVPELSSKPHISVTDDLEEKLSDEDLNEFRNFLTKMKDMSRDFTSSEQIYTDLLLFSRLLKTNKTLIDKLMSLNK